MSDKICTKCKTNVITTSKIWCNECSKAYERKRWNNLSVEERRAKWLRSKYNLSYEEYKSMYEEQNGECYLCKIPLSITTSKNEHKTACVDHCHDTGKVRKLLCNHCNRAIGLLKEDITVLENIITYLRSYK